MATYAIGDIQGCYASFIQLLQFIDFNPGKDTLWLTGDLVNRGPQSLEVLRWVLKHQDQVEIVLGNHDVHLLAVAEGLGTLHRYDTLGEVLNAVDAKMLLAWLRCQPFMIAGHGYAMVHAGLLPEWSIQKAMDLAEEVRCALSGQHYRDVLACIHGHGNYPARWHDGLEGNDRLRVIANAMTRMRFITREGEIDLQYNGTPDQAPTYLIPWFDFPKKRYVEARVICGHWAALGLHITAEVLVLDSGCLWGGALTAFGLGDEQMFSLPCPISCSL